MSDDTAGARKGVEVIHRTSRQIGGVNVTFTFGRLTRSKPNQEIASADRQPNY